MTALWVFGLILPGICEEVFKHDDTFDQELAQAMENEAESYFPGDEGYDCEYEVDHAALMDSAVSELDGLQV